MSSLNDPRVLFAAERTLLAWNRTAVSLITLGFVIERFGLFITELHYTEVVGQRSLSFSIGLALIGFATVISILSTAQFRRVVQRLSPPEIPHGYWLWTGILSNIVVGLLGVLLMVYLIRGFA